MDIPAAMHRDFNGNSSLAYIIGMFIMAAVTNRQTTTNITGI